MTQTIVVEPIPQPIELEVVPFGCDPDTCPYCNAEEES